MLQKEIGSYDFISHLKSKKLDVSDSFIQKILSSEDIAQSWATDFHDPGIKLQQTKCLDPDSSKYPIS